MLKFKSKPGLFYFCCTVVLFMCTNKLDVTQMCVCGGPRGQRGYLRFSSHGRRRRDFLPVFVALAVATGDRTAARGANGRKIITNNAALNLIIIIIIIRECG